MTYKIASLIFTLILACVSSCGYAEKEYIVSAVEDIQASWGFVEIFASLPESESAVRVEAKVHKSKEKMEYLKINLPNKEIVVPQKYMKEVNSPHLNTIKTYYTPINKEDKNWLLTVSFEFGEWIEGNAEEVGESSNIEIGIDNNGLLDVLINDAKSNTSKYIYERN
tara:strand:- start:590 stop:1090 length:501 start_codon:yes stop_codon:yes gene_type:complete